jgi:hypothetical protein
MNDNDIRSAIGQEGYAPVTQSGAGNGNDTLLRAVTAVRTAKDYVALPGYRALPPQAPSATVWEYRDEKDFWADVLGDGKPGQRLVAGDQVSLKTFRLSTWVPRVPGLYWKAESRRLRAAAQGERLPPGAGLGIYTPVGKTLQVMGGVGNVRLLPAGSGRVICASSSGFYWQGVPVLVQNDAWQAYGDVPAGLECDLTGTWTPMPREHAQVLGGDAGIPRYCLVVNQRQDITPLKDAWPGSSSAWTLFEYQDMDSRSHYDFVYCTWELNRGSPLRRPAEEDAHNTSEASEFLQEYMHQYHGEAMTDFDEEMPHFDAYLPVNELMNRQVDPARLRAFVERIKKQALSPEAVRYEELPKLLLKHFDADELRMLALDHLGLDLLKLIGPTAGLVDKVDALVQYCERNDRLEDLATGMIQERPQVRDELAVKPGGNGGI